MQTIDLTALTNQDFKLTLDMTAWKAAGYDLTPTSKIKMEARRAPSDPTVPLVWSNQPADSAQGTITLSGNNLVFAMPAAAVAARVTSLLNFVYDARIETVDYRTVTMFGGTLIFAQGVTR